MSASTFEDFLESQEAEFTTIAVIRSEQLPGSRSGDIPLSVQELVSDGKLEVVERSSKIVDRDNELLPFIKEIFVSRKHTRASERLYINVFQRTSSKDKNLVERPKHVIGGSEEGVGPKKGQHPCGSSPSLHKLQEKGRKAPKTNPKVKQKSKWNKPYPQSYRVPKKERTSMDNVFNMERDFMGFKNKEEDIMNQHFPKKSLVQSLSLNLVSQ
ncbi:hypothetical protein O181_050515 [Austropuccinia psidii MF-1]|uniref:Uncharacterized protein n=1 Tax=Austropuccinia psidii MF-1 TaxID=1389203 RepID=A0A9Q3E175_9BASI|nr:hypothetical protein [Austropuccinia psidii MF-1]